MFVAMNVFTCEDDASAALLEERFRKRSGAVDQQPGFLSFGLLKCVENPRRIISMSHWRSKEDFDAWTKSQAFDRAHQKPAGGEAPKAPPPHAAMKVANALETYEVVTHSEKKA